MYVSRDATGKITGVFNNEQSYAIEVLADNSPELLALSQVPDSTGFAQAVKQGVGGILAANALMVVYPAFFPAIQAQQWVDVQALILDANSRSVITSAQYTAIKTAAVAYHIPLVLP
jgi:hypothetical protein